MSDYEINQKGYAPVKCDKPLPCPFCGAEPKLAQLAHHMRSERIGRSRRFRQVRVCIIASTATLTADAFWFRCPVCDCSTGGHKGTALEASQAWNRRTANLMNEQKEDAR
jgi:hypothetical protein